MKSLLLAVGAALVVVAGGGGYAVGHHAANSGNQEQLATCGDVADALLAELQNAFSVVEAGDDTVALKSAYEQQQRLADDMRRQFGTDHVPTVIAKCKEGE